jgi:ribose transport system ATP-binding protein
LARSEAANLRVMTDTDTHSTGPGPRAGDEVLSVRGLRKTFPGVVALDAVDFDVKAGEVHALLGANGAGKSTLIKVVAGLYSPDAGEIALSGRPTSFTGAADAMAAGVSVIYQDFALIPYLSVAENIFLGNEILGQFGLVDWAATHREARRLLDLVGCAFPTETMVWELGAGHRQLVEVAKALRREARVLVLDEPTASLSQGESARLFDLIRELKRKQVGMVYVSHRLDEIAGLVDRVTVLRDGKSMGTFPAAEIDRRKIVSLITGHDALPTRSRQSARQNEKPLLVTKQLSRKGEFEDISIDLRRGEIVVITGLIGSGRTELLETLFRARRPDGGEICLDGRKCDSASVRSAIRDGIVLIPEDRRGHGLCMILPIYENIAMATMRRFLGALGLSRRSEIEHADTMIRALNIKPADAVVEAGTLSGGNQQKVVLAKWLSTEANVFLFDEPTQGVDVGAKNEIHDIVRNLAADGKAILIASSDLEEVLGIADRVLVMRQGQIVAEFSGAAVKASAVVEAITHGSFA